MRLIFNHDDDSPLAHNHSPKILQASHAPGTSAVARDTLTIIPKPTRVAPKSRDVTEEEETKEVLYS